MATGLCFSVPASVLPHAQPSPQPGVGPGPRSQLLTPNPSSVSKVTLARRLWGPLSRTPRLRFKIPSFATAVKTVLGLHARPCSLLRAVGREVLYPAGAMSSQVIPREVPAPRAGGGELWCRAWWSRSLRGRVLRLLVLWDLSPQVGIRHFTSNPRLVRTLHGARGKGQGAGSAWCCFPKQASLRVCTL